MKSRNLTAFVSVLITIMLVVNFNIYSKIVTHSVPEANYTSDSSDTVKEPTPEELLQADIQNNFTDIEATAPDTKCGELVLVNKTNQYDFDAVTSLYTQEYPQSIYESKSSNYYVKNTNLSLNLTAINALNELLDDFYDQISRKEIIIVDGFRTYEWQQVVLDAKIQQLGEEQGRLIACEPGASEHHTGYALDLSLYIDGIQQEYDGTGDYQWITDNCYKYGFVIRYPENKTGVTGINYEPWHLRYVGKPHALYMTKNNLCLEEYINMLHLYPIDSKRLQVATEDGATYEIYSCPVTGDASKIKVPKNDSYTLSGDNAGYMIVTVQKSQASAAVPSDTAGADGTNNANTNVENE